MRGRRCRSGQSLVESAVTLALISIIVLAVIKGVATQSTNRLVQARDALHFGQTGSTPPPISGSSSDTE